MTRRAWWLIVLSILIPGSAQLLAGNRRLGRFLFGSWLGMLAVVALAFALNAVWPAVALTIATSWWGLLVLQVGLVFVAVVWFIAAVDTFDSCVSSMLALAQRRGLLPSQSCR